MTPTTLTSTRGRWAGLLLALAGLVVAATREHCQASGGGMWFRSYADFESALDLLLGDSALAAAVGGRGKAYVEARYRWPRLIDRYTRFLARVAARASDKNGRP